MPLSIDDQFDAIIQDALQKAAAVPCSPADYRQALRAWLEEIQTCLDASGETEEGESDEE